MADQQIDPASETPSTADSDLKYQIQYTNKQEVKAVSSDNKKSLSQMNALERLKYIQARFLTTWKGHNCKETGKPGTSDIVNKKRHFTLAEENQKFKQRETDLFSIFTYLKEFENPKALQEERETTLTFEAIKESQLLYNAPPSMSFAKSYHFENTELLYKLFTGDTKLVRSMFEANGFTHTESHEWNLLWSSSSCKSYLYEGLNEYQKINHFPSSYEITRKDRLTYNYIKMQQRHGRKDFDFVPDTYVIPDEYGDFFQHYQQLKQIDSQKNMWIVKPANMSRGRGIYITNDINEIIVDQTCVVSRYVTNPLLINGHKFDLRVYVVVTSYEPLRIYVYKEGLARFASETYTTKITKESRYQHLTNYSINKKNENFVQNDNSEEDDVGFKWSLTAFCSHLEQVGIDMDLLWSRVYDICIKTILCGENHVIGALKKNGNFRSNCFEVFGFDILIDSDLKPWLIEVNLSPSLVTDSPIDMSIKSNLIADTFNMIGIRQFDRKKESVNKVKNRMRGYNSKNSTSVREKTVIGQKGDIYVSQVPSQTLANLSVFCNTQQEGAGKYTHFMKRAIFLKQKEQIRETLAESQKMGQFVRIYPARCTDRYDKFFVSNRPFNKLVHRVLYSNEILPQDEIGICKEIQSQEIQDEISQEEEKEAIDQEIIDEDEPADIQKAEKIEEKVRQKQVEEQKSKVLITGDDILIEYVERLIKIVKTKPNDFLGDELKQRIHNFVTHYVWHEKEPRQNKDAAQSVRLDLRLQEMLDRRKKLHKYNAEQEKKTATFLNDFNTMLKQKREIISKFKPEHLENLLKSSTKNIAYEVVLTLMPEDHERGILAELDQAPKLSENLVRRPSPMKKMYT